MVTIQHITSKNFAHGKKPIQKGPDEL